ncbi:MAG: hypothetical protein Fues2KO_22970 [Fuerstiella sp.]
MNLTMTVSNDENASESVAENPYSAPMMSESAESDVTGLSSDLTAVLRVRCSMAYYMKAFERSRQQLRQPKQRLSNNFVFAVFFFVLLVMSLPLKNSVVSAVLFVLAVYAAFYPWIARRNTRKAVAASPHLDSELKFTVTDQTLRATTELTDHTTSWKAFQKLTSFDDGVLIAQDVRTLHWLPFDAIVNDVPPTLLVSMLAERIAVHDDRRTEPAA